MDPNMEGAVNEENSQQDELIIDHENVKTLAQYKGRIEEMFDVQIRYGLKASDQVKEKQWISVFGEVEDRRNAKDYIKTLCNPEEIVPMSFPPELHCILTKPKIHIKLERQSKTAILFPHEGEAHIQGLDALSVTLAMSAIEDLIAKYDEGDDAEEVPSPMARMVSSRLESELRRLSSQDENIVYDEDYGSMPEPVKRTILGWFIEEGHQGDEAQKETVQVPKTVAGNHSTKSIETVVDNISKVDIDSSAASSKSEFELSLASPNVKYLRDFALNKGYTDDEIISVFKKHGTNLKASDFLNSLFENKQQNTHHGLPQHPIEQILQTHSPKIKQKKKHKNKVDQGASTEVPREDVFVGYLERLSKDFNEEEESSVEELKLRSAERLRLLREAFNKQDEGEAVLVESKTKDKKKAKEPLTWQQQQLQQGDLTENGNFPSRPQQYGNKKQQGSMNQLDDFHMPNRNPNQGAQTRQYNRTNGRGGQSNARSRSPRDAQAGGGRFSPTRTVQGYSIRQGDHQNGGAGRFSPTRAAQIANSPKQGYLRPGEQQANDKYRQGMPPPHISPRSNLKYIIIDGSNIAMTHGNGAVFSCRGIEICIEFFLQRGHTEITVFVPQWRTQIPKVGYDISDQHLLQELKNRGFLVFTPARRVPGKNIVCYDDKFVLKLAEETDGIVVSNDNYRDLWKEKREWRRIIEERLLPYSFVGDFFMPPDDPLGREGPDLDEFLTKQDDDVAPGTHTRTTQRIRYNSGSEGRGRAQNWQQVPFQPRGFQQPHALLPTPAQFQPPLGPGRFQGPPGGQALYQAPQGQGQGQGHFQRAPGGGWGTQNQQSTLRQQQFQHRQIGDGYQPRNNSQSGPRPPNQQNQRNPNASGGATVGQQNPGSSRIPSVTSWLQKNLYAVFPQSQETVDKILSNHPTEQDLNKLSTFILEVLSGES